MSSALDPAAQKRTAERLAEVVSLTDGIHAALRMFEVAAEIEPNEEFRKKCFAHVAKARAGIDQFQDALRELRREFLP